MLWEKLDGWFDKAAGFTRVALVFLGFALIRRWLSLVTFLVPAHVAATLPLSMSTLFALVQCATSVAVVVASHRLAPLHRRGPFLGGSVALLSGGTLLAAFSGSFSPASPRVHGGRRLGGCGLFRAVRPLARALTGAPRSREGRRRLRRFVRGVQRPLVGAAALGRAGARRRFGAVAGGFAADAGLGLPQDPPQPPAVRPAVRVLVLVGGDSFFLDSCLQLRLRGGGIHRLARIRLLCLRGALVPEHRRSGGHHVLRQEVRSRHHLPHGAAPHAPWGLDSAIVAGDPYVTQFFVTAG